MSIAAEVPSAAARMTWWGWGGGRRTSPTAHTSGCEVAPASDVTMNPLSSSLQPRASANAARAHERAHEHGVRADRGSVDELDRLQTRPLADEAASAIDGHDGDLRCPVV